MKKRNRAAALLIGALLCLALTACAGEPPVSPVYTLNQAAVELKVGGTFQLAVTSEPEAELQLTYKSGNEEVATVSASGLITAVAPGSAEVTVTANGTALKCAVTVKPYVYTLNQAAVELKAGGTFQLAVTSEPEAELQLTYKSENEEVATVSASGLITAVAPGSAEVTVTANGTALKCAVTVKPYVYTLNQETLTLKPGKTFQLAVTAEPQKEIAVTYASDKVEVATVSASGLVTAVAPGTAKVTATADGKALVCVVTVDLDAEATVTTKPAEGAVYLTDVDGALQNPDALDTLYWEHYGWNGVVNSALNAEDLITDNTIENVTQYFNDYKADINWSNGSKNRSWYLNHDGRCATEDVTFNVQISEGLTELRIYTGAWKATNTTKLSARGAVLASAQPFTAGDASENTVVTFRVTAEAAQTVTVTISPSAMQEGGNVSLVAVAVLGTRAEESAVTATVAEKTEMTGHNDCKVNLTEKGALDWFYLNYEHESDEKAGADFIKADTLNVESNGEFWDYKAAFKWTDGTKYENSPIDNDCDDAGTNNGKCGAYVSVDVAVTAETQNVYLWVGGYDASEYYVEAVDSAGNVVLNALVGTSDPSQTLAYELQIGVRTERAETLTFIIYRTAGNNCSLAAVAVA